MSNGWTRKLLHFYLSKLVFKLGKVVLFVSNCRPTTRNNECNSLCRPSIRHYEEITTCNVSLHYYFLPTWPLAMPSNKDFFQHLIRKERCLMLDNKGRVDSQSLVQFNTTTDRSKPSIRTKPSTFFNSRRFCKAKTLRGVVLDGILLGHVRRISMILLPVLAIIILYYIMSCEDTSFTFYAIPKHSTKRIWLAPFIRNVR
mmetsp:Transcript_24698/g.40027  ORF Transcript_24698/g.40027 Transcript_24698/m.40027 type:complete len:200 (-) Transcript_24698:3869-4468(-)